ncbi:MAG: hypothetical protein ACLQDM_24685 [Bradyrhizobium sp.]
MLGFLFGFNARLGRLHFFLSTVALNIAMAVVGLVIANHAIHQSPKVQLAEELTTWPVIVAVVVYSWASFMLQSMRVRDIGWDPVCVIPAWIAVTIVDHAVAVKFPAWALGHGHHGTTVGAMVNLAFILMLTFWPSGEFAASPPRPPDGPSRGRSAVPAARLARSAGTGFGRRAF